MSQTDLKTLRRVRHPTLKSHHCLECGPYKQTAGKGYPVTPLGPSIQCIWVCLFSQGPDQSICDYCSCCLGNSDSLGELWEKKKKIASFHLCSRCCLSRAEIHSYSLERVNTKAVTSEPVSKYAAWRLLWFSTLKSVHTLTSKHKHHNRRYAPQTQHITSHHSINNRLFRVNVFEIKSMTFVVNKSLSNKKKRKKSALLSLSMACPLLPCPQA